MQFMLLVRILALWLSRPKDKEMSLLPQRWSGENSSGLGREVQVQLFLKKRRYARIRLDYFYPGGANLMKILWSARIGLAHNGVAFTNQLAAIAAAAVLLCQQPCIDRVVLLVIFGYDEHSCQMAIAGKAIVDIKGWLNQVNYHVNIMAKLCPPSTENNVKMACRNICEKYRAVKDRRSSYYAQGYKRCQVCDLFISWRGTKCPCCQMTLRTKPHNKESLANGWFWKGLTMLIMT